MKIFISYSRTESVTYCFWKYFFDSCGIWFSAKEITDDWSGSHAVEVPHFAILSEGEIGKIRAEEISPNCVYQIGKQNLNLKYATGVLQRLLDGYREQSEICNLMEIFWNTGLWGASWLFHEIAQSWTNRWKQEISNSCSQAIHLLEGKSGWYDGHMRLYCEYIYSGAISWDPVERMIQSDRLLGKCSERLWQGQSTPPFWILAGKICELSKTTNKKAIDMYLHALQCEKLAQLYYDVGHIYDKACGDEMLAYKYFEQAIDIDPRYYRALYKMAVKAEKDGNWMEAVDYYNKIKRILKDIEAFDCISIRGVEYLYKTNRDIMNICKKYIIGSDLVEKYRIEVEKIYDHLDEILNLRNLVCCMFGSEAEEKYQEIVKEVRNKFNTECFKIRKTEIYYK